MLIQHHFGLKHIPLAKNNSFLWKDQAYKQLKEYFTQLLHMPGIGVLTGEPGVGKTAMLRHIVQEVNPHQYQVFYIAETQFTSFDIYRQVAFALKLVPSHRYSQLWRDIKNHIRERVEHKHILPIFIIDEAQNLPFDFFQSFPSFLNFDYDARDMMTIWFVGHTALSNILDRTMYTALASRIQVRYQLQPIMERERFAGLIQHAFKEAGSQSSLLSDSGIELLRIASQGKPRYVNRILVGAMQLAAQRGINHLPDDLLQEAITQLKG
jgi:MSHA biogenesis protein MshM